jgi:hypothetical protein
MIPIKFSVGNKLSGKSLIAALAPLTRMLGRYREVRKSSAGLFRGKAGKGSIG